MKKITEKDNLQDEWYKEASQVTKLSHFEKLHHKLINDFEHDYGTICHAITSLAIAAANLMNKSKQGGITGFQANAITLEFVHRWGHFSPPFRITAFKDMLFPGREYKFNTICKDTWEYLQKEAQKLLKESPDADPKVTAHWQNIVAGRVPFGFIIAEND